MDALLNAIVPDSTDGGRAREQGLYLAKAEDLTFTCVVRDSDGVIVDLSTTALVFTVKKLLTGAPLIAKEAVVSDPTTGTGVFTLTPNDTLYLDVRKYSYDIQIRYLDGGMDQILPPSPFVLGPVVGIPGEDVTVSTAEQPLALGPKGDTGNTGATGPVGPSVYWSPDKTWAEIDAIIDTFTNRMAIVIVPASPAVALPTGTYTITAGTYAMNNVQFIGVGTDLAQVRIDDGVTFDVDGNGYVILSAQGIYFTIAGALTAPGLAQLILNIPNCQIANSSATESTFPQVAGVQLTGGRNSSGTLLSNYGGRTVIDLSTGGSLGAVLTDIGPIGNNASIGGDGSVVLYGSPEAIYASCDTQIYTGTVSVGSTTPSITMLGDTNSNPPRRAGALGFDASSGVPKISDGTSWNPLTGTESVFGVQIIDQGALIKKGGGIANYYDIWLTTDSPLLILGSAASPCAGVDSPFTAAFPTQVVNLLSDGQAIIPVDSPVVASDLTDGRVKAGSVTDAGFVGFNVGNEVDAVADATVRVR